MSRSSKVWRYPFIVLIPAGGQLRKIPSPSFKRAARPGVYMSGMICKASHEVGADLSEEAAGRRRAFCFW